jgi:hypothetical protein
MTAKRRVGISLIYNAALVLEVVVVRHAVQLGFIEFS